MDRGTWWAIIHRIAKSDQLTHTHTHTHTHTNYCCFSVTKSCSTLCNPMDTAFQAFLSFIQYFLEFAQTQVHWVDDAIQPPHLCYHLLLLPSIFPSIMDFSNESSLPIRWPKCWSFSISLSTDYSRFISFRINCFDLLAVQKTLKILLQNHSFKASILQCSAFFMVQLSHLYMTTGKTTNFDYIDLCHLRDVTDF